MLNEEYLKILLVEDDEVDRMAVGRALHKAGLTGEIVETETCKNAIAHLNKQQFDCIFSDYRLPDGTALELLQQICEHHKPAPLVVLTGQGDEQIAVELMKAGASDYLAKSQISPEYLARSLCRAIRLHRAEQKAQQANQRLFESEERYRLVLEGSNDGIWDWDIKEGVIYANDRLLEIVGMQNPTTQSLPKFPLTLQNLKEPSHPLFWRLHPQDRDRLVKVVQNHLKDNIDLDVEFRILHSQGDYRYCIVRGKAQGRNPNDPVRLAGTVTDITERKRSEERSRFLATATTLLSSSLDYKTTLKTLAHLIVPDLADWTTINLADTDNAPHLIAVAHTNPKKEPLVWQLQEENRTPQTHHVFQTGESLGGYYVCQGSMALIAFNQNQQQLFQQLQCHSYICVPLWTREKIIGSILCVWGESPRHYNAEDLKLIEDLAYRAAFAIENARLYKEAQEAAKTKAQFLALMSHELRTPMNAIIGFSQVLLRQRSGQLSSQQVSMIERIHNNGKNLLDLINDILDLSKIEANRLALKPEPLNLVQLIATTLDSLRPLADEKGLDLRFASAIDKLEIHNDRDRFRQILINLLSNGIKFTQEGSVTVTLDLPSPKQLQITVEDTGIGIKPEDQAYIFTEFCQVDQTSSRQYSGTGLGLAITKSLVELMGGEIMLKSQLNEGTTFKIIMPIKVQIA